MNNDIQLYKERFLTFFLLLSYTYMHLKLTGIYIDATFDLQINFAARLPFGQRMLIPALAHYFTYVWPLKTDYVFFLFEWLSVWLLFWSIFKLLSVEFTINQAKLLSWLFILLLPLITVINYRYTMGKEATFLYVYDTPSIFFIALGYLFCLRQQWFLLLTLIFLATLNRESSILLVLLIPTLHSDNWRTLYRPIGAALLVYLIARCIIFFLAHNLPGSWTEWYTQIPGLTNFSLNLWWLLDSQNFLMILYCFAGMIVFWFVFYDFIPLRYRPIKYVALLYFIGLLCVGRIAEARIFCEIVVIMYLPVCIALSRWGSGLEPVSPTTRGFYYYLDRYAVLGILLLLFITRQILNNLILSFF